MAFPSTFPMNFLDSRLLFAKRLKIKTQNKRSKLFKHRSICHSHNKMNPSNRASFSIPRESWVGFLSSFSEAYNMAAVLFMAPILAPLLFKNSSQASSIVLSYTLIFVGSFLMYPLGAWYYGRIGDIQGRRTACISSSLGLAIITGSIAFLPINFLPNYTWIFFLILLALQFFFSAGEYYSSIVFSLEHGSPKYQGLMSGISCFFAVLGLLLANGLSILSVRFSAIVSWRLVFIIGLLTGLLSFGFKFYCKESPLFNHNNNETKSISWDFIKENFLIIISVTFVTGLFYSIYSYTFLFLPLIYSDSAISNSQSETFFCLIIYGLGLLLTGYLSDKYKIKRTMCFGLISLLLLLLLFIPFFHSIPFITRALLTFSACIYIGPIHSWVIEQSHPHKRCRITAISTALASALFSNSCVLLCMFFYRTYSSLWLGSIYIVVLATIALCILLTTHNKIYT